MLLFVSILAPSLLLLRPSYKQLVGGGGGRLPLERSVDALLQLPEQGSGLLFQDSKKAMTAQAEHVPSYLRPSPHNTRTRSPRCSDATRHTTCPTAARGISLSPRDWLRARSIGAPRGRQTPAEFLQARRGVKRSSLL